MEGMMPGRGGFPFGAPGRQPAEESAPEAPEAAGPRMRLNALANLAPGMFGGFGQPAATGAGGPAATGVGGLFGLPVLPGMGAPAEPPPTPPSMPTPTLPTRPEGVRPPFVRPGGLDLGGVIRPPIRPFPLPRPVSKTATQLAQSALVTLRDASAEVVDEALNTLRARNVAADHLIDYLERRVRVGEVLNQLAATWSDTTVGDFADAFQMDRGKRDVMDAIVAIGILNEPELNEEILVENTPQTSEEDLLDNRVIVDQWPPGGTVMQPPYLLLVAVEYRDVAQAEELVESIMGELVEHAGVKLPRGVVERLRARG